jgi:hypothetical protein
VASDALACRPLAGRATLLTMRDWQSAKKHGLILRSIAAKRYVSKDDPDGNFRT